VILEEIIQLEFEDQPDYSTYREMIKKLLINYKLVSTFIVKNFREEAKPRD